MAITEIRIYTVELAAKQLYNMSNSAVATPTSTIIEVIDSSGHVGYGEVCLASPQYQPAHNDGIRTSLEILAPAVLGCDPECETVLNATMNQAMDGHTEGKAALDIACWDLSGKIANRSVVDLLGGALQQDVATYHVVGIGTPDYAAAETERLQNEGITRIQLKAGGRPIHQDIACIHAVSKVIQPGSDLAIDTNRGWTTAEAIHVSNACANINLSLEQPCATENELIQLKKQVNHPVIVDENSTDITAVARMISYGLADGFGLKLTRLGGLTNMRAVRDLCIDRKSVV